MQEFLAMATAMLMLAFAGSVGEDTAVLPTVAPDRAHVALR